MAEPELNPYYAFLWGWVFAVAGLVALPAVIDVWIKDDGRPDWYSWSTKSRLMIFAVVASVVIIAYGIVLICTNWQYAA